MTLQAQAATHADTSELFARYAELCAEDLDIGDLMNHQKAEIESRLTDLSDVEALEEIEESVYADDLADALEDAEQGGDTTELYADYAQRCVEDIDSGDLESSVAASIDERISDLPLVEAIEEIEESSYRDQLEAELSALRAAA